MSRLWLGKEVVGEVVGSETVVVRKGYVGGGGYEVGQGVGGKGL